MKKREAFTSKHDQYRMHLGKGFKIIGEVPSDKMDEEVGKMYYIKFDDGTVIEAFPEEIYYEPKTT